MLKATGITLVVLAGLAMPASAESLPNRAGSWTCDAAPMVIRDQWTTLTYTIEVAEQKEALFTGEMTWVLPEDKGAEGNQGGESSYSGTIKFLGVVDFDDGMRARPTVPIELEVALSQAAALRIQGSSRGTPERSSATRADQVP